MFKLLIAEDEILAREAIERSIDFEALNFRLVASCEDGQEAWEAYQREKPDVVLTDINMPNLSGLELAKAIHEDKRDCLVIIITGHDDFHFARKAISYQVADYLLKPVTPRELREILAKNAELLAEKATRQAKIQAQVSQSYRTETLAKNQILNRFISGSLNRSNFEISDPELQRLFNYKKYRLALLSHNTSPKKMDELKLNTQDVLYLLFNLAEELSAQSPALTVFMAVENSIVLICGGDDEKMLEKQLRQFIEQLAVTFRELTHLEFRAGYSLSCSEDKLPKAKGQADQALAFATTAKLYLIVSYSEMHQLTKKRIAEGHDELLRAVTEGSEDKLQMAVTQFFSSLRFSETGKEELQQNYKQIFSELEGLGIFLSSKLSERLLHSDLQENAHVPVIEQFYKELRQGMRELQNGKPNTAKQIIVTARHYIDRNYASSNLSLINLCTQLNVSMSYFSSIFKNETGQTFVEYLTEVRMRNAKKLLTESNLMLYNVAEKVGYDSAAYFTAAFKKNTGYTPKEYRKHFSVEASE